MSPDELIAALNVERYGNSRWFTRPSSADESALDDSDIATAQRRRALLADDDRLHNAKEA